MMDGEGGRRRLAWLVKQQRQSLGLSVRAAAGKAGVDRATWSGMEDGSRGTQDRQFAGIERALEWPPGAIDAILRNEPTQTLYGAAPRAPWSHTSDDGTLGDLIAARRNEIELTYEQLVARAATLGHEISSRTLMRLANDNPTEYPGPTTLRAVAAAMDLPIADVQRAATRTAHLWPVPKHDNRAAAWAELVGDLEPAEIDHVLDVARAAVKALKSPRPSPDTSQGATERPRLSPERG